MPAFATAAEFLERVDEYFIDQLAARDGGAVDETRITHALEDASAEMELWLLRVPSSRQPSDDTKRIHCIKVALYLMTLNRPVADFDQIRTTYEDTRKEYLALAEEGADAASSASMGKSNNPCPAFTDKTLKGLV